jgi:hypothetical protein
MARPKIGLNEGCQCTASYHKHTHTVQDHSQQAQQNSPSAVDVCLVAANEGFAAANDDAVHLPTGPLAGVRQGCPKLWVILEVLQGHRNRRL